jgi:hypothetical protein
MTVQSGASITSAMINSLSQPAKGAILTQAGTYLTTSATTELALPKFSLAGVTVPPNGVMKFDLNTRLSGGSGTAVAGDTFEFRVRQTTALSGTLVAQVRYIVPSANQANFSPNYVWAPATNSVINTTFHLSLVRIAGTGVLGIEAGSLSSFGIYLISDTVNVWGLIP